MPFRYRLQKILDFRIRKKEEQLLVVQKAQQEVIIAEENIRKNNAEIEATKSNMRQADPMMYEAYDNYLVHLWERQNNWNKFVLKNKIFLMRKSTNSFFLSRL